MKKVIFGMSVAALMVSLAACDDNAGNAGDRSVVNASMTTEADTGATDATDTSAGSGALTDVSVISEIFPGLEGIDSVEYEVVPLGTNNSPDVAGPTDYQYQGYIVLTDEAAEALTAAYEWEDAEPEVAFVSITDRGGDYKSCVNLINDTLKKASYSGNAWYNADEKTVLFAVHTW